MIQLACEYREAEVNVATTPKQDPASIKPYVASYEGAPYVGAVFPVTDEGQQMRSENVTICNIPAVSLNSINKQYYLQSILWSRHDIFIT